MNMNVYKDFSRVKFGRNHWKKNGRQPADPEKKPLRFTEVAPMKLKNFVVGKGGHTSDVCCITEMMKMFECLQLNEFDQTKCGAQVTTFQSCYTAHVDEVHAKKAAGKNVQPTPGAKRLPAEQLNNLLKMYPQKVDL